MRSNQFALMERHYQHGALFIVNVLMGIPYVNKNKVFTRRKEQHQSCRDCFCICICEEMKKDLEGKVNFRDEIFE